MPIQPSQDLAGLPPWMAAMRAAAQNAITADDVREIVVEQVKRAKRGNRDALKFVFEHVIGTKAYGPLTLVQNNNYGDGDPGRETNSRPGTQEKIATMRRRAEAGLPLTRNNDGPRVDLR